MKTIPAMRDNIEIATAAPSALRFMAVALPGTQFMLTALPKMKSEIGPVIKKKLCQRNCQNIISNISGKLIEKNRGSGSEISGNNGCK